MGVRVEDTNVSYSLPQPPGARVLRLVSVDLNVKELTLSIVERLDTINGVSTYDFCTLVWIVHHFHVDKFLNNYVDCTSLTEV